MKNKSKLTGEHPIKTYLAELPEGYRERAISQIGDHLNKEKGDDKVSSLGYAVLFFRGWKETAEGDDFWNAVYLWVTKDEELPPFPESELNKIQKELQELRTDRDEWKDAAMQMKGYWRESQRELNELKAAQTLSKECNMDFSKELTHIVGLMSRNCYDLSEMEHLRSMLNKVVDAWRADHNAKRNAFLKIKG